jgi:transcriptional regulator with XRE-family HTH domain
MDNTHEILMRRLKELRAKRKLSQEELAERAGITSQYLSRLENGRHDPSLSVLVKLANALGVKVGKLLDDNKGE